MYSTHHVAISLLVGWIVAAVVAPVTVAGRAFSVGPLTAYAVAVGVLIDLDHLLLARLETGTWEAVRFCLAHPRAAVLDQSRIFSPGDVGVVRRLGSHLVAIGLVVGSTWTIEPELGVVTATVLYTHLLSDVAWDLRRLRRHDAAPVTVPEDR